MSTHRFMSMHNLKELRAPLRQMLTLIVWRKLYLVLVFLCEMPHSIVQCKPSYHRLQSFRKTLRLRHYERAGPVKPIAKQQLDALTSHLLLSNVFYPHNISKNIFELQSIIALPSCKFMLNKCIPEQLRISMSSGLKSFSQVYAFPFSICSLHVLSATLCFEISFNQAFLQLSDINFDWWFSSVHFDGNLNIPISLCRLQEPHLTTQQFSPVILVGCDKVFDIFRISVLEKEP